MKLFEKNVGGIDKAARIFAGILLLAGAYLVQADLLIKAVIALVGIVVLFTGVMGTCTLYTLLGINTAKKK